MNEELLNEIKEEMGALKDLFLRRLMDDKVKAAAISQLKEENEKLQERLDDKSLAGFVKELLMVCDRVEAQDEIDSLTSSVIEELLELLARREIYQIKRPTVFDPKYHNAVGTVLANEDYPENSIVRVVRNGYLFRDQLFRPVDVVVAVCSSEVRK